MIVDAHIHLSESPQDELIQYATANGLRYDLPELLALMKSHDIDHGLLLSPPVRGGLPLANEKILDLCRRSGGVLSPVLTVEPYADDVSRAIELARRSQEVKGFKIRLGYLRVFADDPVFDPLYAHAEATYRPVMFHTGDTATSNGSLEHAHPLTLDRLANARPGLKMVACHFGNPWIRDVAELVYKHSNVYADISGLIVGGSKYLEGYIGSLADQLTQAVYFAGGAQKVIFGTDYPVSTPSLALQLVEKMDVDEADRAAILSANARRVFRI